MIEELPVSEISNHFFETFDQFTQLLPVFVRQRKKSVRQRFHVASAAFLKDPGSFCSCFEPHASPVFCFSPAHQACANQASDDAAHSRWPDLLRFGKLAERSWATPQNQHRQCRELRRADAAFAVAHAQPPQQVDGCGMQPVGGLESLPAGETFGLDIRHTM